MSQTTTQGPIIQLPRQALRTGVVILDLKEFEKIQEKAKPTNTVPAYQLKGKEAEELDNLVKEGLKEYRAGRCKTINSLADLD